MTNILDKNSVDLIKVYITFDTSDLTTMLTNDLKRTFTYLVILKVSNNFSELQDKRNKIFHKKSLTSFYDIS